MPHPETPLPSNNDAPQGLPPVKPPSGRFILQLFLIPGLIVAGLIFVFIFGSMSLVATSTPEAFLGKLDNPNPEIRWRAAHELAQVLKRPESLELASNPDFALDIAERLLKANKELEEAEEIATAELRRTFDQIKNDRTLSSEQRAEREEQAGQVAWRKLRPQRDLVLFLTSCLGDFNIPVGVHALGAVAMKDKGEYRGVSLRRKRAVWALANLGSNIQQRWHGKNVKEDTPVLTAEQKQAVLDKLAKAATGGTERAKMAHYAYDVLAKKAPSEVDKILDVCSKADDIFLREVTALALNFWDGPLVEPTLLRLARDEGKGKRVVVTDSD